MQRLAHDRRIHSYRTVLVGIEPICAGDRVDVAIEHQAHHASLHIDQGAAGISSHDIVVGGEIERRIQIELIFCLEPGLGNLVRLLARIPLVQTPQIRERFDCAALLGPPLNRAKIQPQREIGIRRHTRAEHSKARPGNLFRGRLLRRLYRVLVTPAHRARGRVDELRELDHRVLGRLDGLLAAVPQLQTHLGIGEPGPLHRTRRERIRRVFR